MKNNAKTYFGVKAEDWDKLTDEQKKVIEEIHIDHVANFENLKRTATSVSNELQSIKHVHSVRWRVKDPNHLSAKIVRKWLGKASKYNDIDVNNYCNKITDLIGLRILHLFKSDFSPIHERIIAKWKRVERPIIYYRKGDAEDILDQYKAQKISTKIHKSGYRSAHYVLSTSPTIECVKFELQVRTIFEEGWSEIDHSLRYPNFSDNPLIINLLDKINRVASVADEMAELVISIQQYTVKHTKQVDALKKKDLEQQEDLKLLQEKYEEALQNLQDKIEKKEEITKTDVNAFPKPKKLKTSLSLYSEEALTKQFKAFSAIENMQKQFDIFSKFNHLKLPKLGSGLFLNDDDE